jgi:hypothetical protein
VLALVRTKPDLSLRKVDNYTVISEINIAQNKVI